MWRQGFDLNLRMSKKPSQIQTELFSLVKYPSFQVQTCSVFKGTLLTRSEKLTSDVAYLFFLSSKRHIYRHREKTFSATIDKWDLSDLPHNELKIFLKLHCYFYATAFSHQRSKVCAMY